MKRLCAVLSLVLASAPALAFELKPAWYAGAAYETMNLGGDGGSDFDVDAATVKLGAGLHRFMAVEARAGFGVNDDSQGGVTAEIDQFYSAFLKGMVPVHRNVSLYGLAGYSKVEVSASGPLGSGSNDVEDFSYGAGVAWHFNRNVSINAEWVSYVDKEDVEMDGVGLGASFSF